MKGSVAANYAGRGPLNPGSRPFLVVGGKGGVGKTTIASSIAVRLADRGERTLVVSTDPAHSLGDLWDRAIGDEETPLDRNLWGMEIDPDAQVARHLEGVKRAMREFARPELHPEIERQMELARLSPGAVEAAMLERIADLMLAARPRFDRVIFDTAPTGHTLRLLALPEIMAAWTEGLLRQRDRSDSWDSALRRLRRSPEAGEDLPFVDSTSAQEDERSGRIRAILLQRRTKLLQFRRLLLDDASTGFLLVTIPEKLPILESRKAADSLAAHDVPILGLIINRVLPSDDLGSFLEQRRLQESEYLDRIEKEFSDLARVRVPLMPNDVVAISTLRHIGELLLG